MGGGGVDGGRGGEERGWGGKYRSVIVSCASAGVGSSSDNSESEGGDKR